MSSPQNISYIIHFEILKKWYDLIISSIQKFSQNEEEKYINNDKNAILIFHVYIED